MKQVLVDAGVPTARYQAFDRLDPALAYLDTMGDLFVIKTDGLAAGKGVLVTGSRSDARDAVAAYLSGEAFGAAGRYGRDRGGAARSRAVGAGRVRRAPGGAAGPGSGLQAGGRR